MGFSRAEQVVIWLLIGAVALGSIVLGLRQGVLSRPFRSEDVGGVERQLQVEPEPEEGARRIRVHVAGYVESPGVYDLDSDSRVVDAVRVAGGALPEADVNRLNLAQKLKDGQRVYVPPRQSLQSRTGIQGRSSLAWPPPGTGAEGEVVQSSGEGVSGHEEGPIDLNTADEKSLDSLPGIGPSLAQRIVKYRREHGPFNTVDELSEVPGIGPKRLAEIRDLVTVN